MRAVIFFTINQPISATNRRATKPIMANGNAARVFLSIGKPHTSRVALYSIDSCILRLQPKNEVSARDPDRNVRESGEPMRRCFACWLRQDWGCCRIGG